MPYLSHSQCEMWECPRRWYLEKLEHAPQAPSEALILGDAVHQALEADGKAIIRSGKGLDVHALYDVFQETLEDRLRADDPTGLIPLDRVYDMGMRGGAILKAYVEHLQPRYAPLAVEESFTVDIPGSTSWRFTGRIDARVTMPNGTQAIVDFKTGKEEDFKAGRAWEPGAEHAKPQASAYLWADAKQGGSAEYVVFAIFPIKPDGNGGYTCKPRFRTTARSVVRLGEYQDDLLGTIQQIEVAKRTDDFPVRLSKLCAYCNVRGSCPEGEAHLIQIGYPARVPSVARVKEATP